MLEILYELLWYVINVVIVLKLALMSRGVGRGVAPPPPPKPPGLLQRRAGGRPQSAPAHRSHNGGNNNRGEANKAQVQPLKIILCVCVCVCVYVSACLRVDV